MKKTNPFKKKQSAKNLSAQQKQLIKKPLKVKVIRLG